jgi:DDE family transposase
VKRSWFPGLVVDDVRESLVSSSGGLLLTRMARAAGLERCLSQALAPWRGERAVHDPGKILFDLATAVALGGDCLSDLAVVRSQPDLFGQVASDATVSRLIATLAADVEQATAAIRTARADARARVWARRRPVAGPVGGQVVVDLDGVLVTAHSDKEGAAPTFKRGYGFHPMFAFVDHDATGTGETLVGLLRTGSASSFTAADHISEVFLS